MARLLGKVRGFIGKDTGHATFRMIAIRENSYLSVGRNSNCDVSITDDNAVSFAHGGLGIANGNAIWRVVNTVGGTYWNGQLLDADKHREFELSDGDHITVGNTRLVYMERK